MSSRTAAANSFSLTNYKIPLLCNACKYINNVLSNSQLNFQPTNQSSKASFYIFLNGEGMTSLASVEMLFKSNTEVRTATHCARICFQTAHVLVHFLHYPS